MRTVFGSKRRYRGPPPRSSGSGWGGTSVFALRDRGVPLPRLRADEASDRVAALPSERRELSGLFSSGSAVARSAPVPELAVSVAESTTSEAADTDSCPAGTPETAGSSCSAFSPCSAGTTGVVKSGSAFTICANPRPLLVTADHPRPSAVPQPTTRHLVPAARPHHG